MLSSLRKYRSIAASLVGLLLLSVGLPLVRHACAMASGHHAQHSAACCCEREAAGAHDPAPHHGIAGHHDPAASEAPCAAGHTADQPAAYAYTSPVLKGCCSVEVRQAEFNSIFLQKQLYELLSAAALPVLLGPVPERPAPPPLFLSDTGPPAPARIPLHILYASLLN